MKTEGYLFGIGEFQPFLSERYDGEKNETIYEGIYQVNENVLKKSYNDRFEVRIHISRSYPKEIPRVYETNNRLEKCEHKYPDDRLCLETDQNLKAFLKKRPIPTVAEFLQKFVTAFFVNYIYFEENGKYLFGERSHGNQGNVEMYQERFNEKDVSVVFQLLRLVANKTYRGHHLCPCNSKKKIRDCHGKNRLLVNMINGAEQEYYAENYESFLAEMSKSSKGASFVASIEKEDRRSRTKRNSLKSRWALPNVQ